MTILRFALVGSDRETAWSALLGPHTPPMDTGVFVTHQYRNPVARKPSFRIISYQTRSDRHSYGKALEVTALLKNTNFTEYNGATSCISITLSYPFALLPAARLRWYYSNSPCHTDKIPDKINQKSDQFFLVEKNIKFVICLQERREREREKHKIGNQIN